MALVRTILAFVILVILVHVGVVYAGVEANANGLTEVIYSLGTLLESPAQALLSVLPVPSDQQDFLNPGNFYGVALTAIVVYFALYLLLGVGSRN